MVDSNIKAQQLLAQGVQYGKPDKSVTLAEQLEIYDTLLPCAQKVVDLRRKKLDSSQQLEPGEILEMIGIINQDHENEKGETLYKLLINSRVLTHFYHKSEDGLSACLEKAVEAAKDYEKTKRELAEVIFAKLDGQAKENKKLKP